MPANTALPAAEHSAAPAPSDAAATHPAPAATVRQCATAHPGTSRRVHLRQFTRAHEAAQYRHRPSALVAAHKQPVVTTHRDTAQRPLGVVVVNGQSAVLAVACQRRPVLQRITHRLASRTPGQHCVANLQQIRMQVSQHGHRPLLPPWQRKMRLRLPAFYLRCLLTPVSLNSTNCQRFLLQNNIEFDALSQMDSLELDLTAKGWTRRWRRSKRLCAIQLARLTPQRWLPCYSILGQKGDTRIQPQPQNVAAVME